MSVPDPDHVVALLHRLWPPLHVAFERGTTTAREFFAQQHTSPAPWVYPDIVRWAAIKSLKSDGFDAEEDVDLRCLANNGMLIRHEGYRLRVMKALADGSLPGPGPSTQKRDFFRQLSFAGWGEEIRNLVLLWQCDSQFNLESLSLACPKDGIGTKAESHWHVPIPHPAVTTIAAMPTQPEDDLEIESGEVAAAAGGELE